MNLTLVSVLSLIPFISERNIKCKDVPITKQCCMKVYGRCGSKVSYILDLRTKWK